MTTTVSDDPDGTTGEPKNLKELCMRAPRCLDAADGLWEEEKHGSRTRGREDRAGA